MRGCCVVLLLLAVAVEPHFAHEREKRELLRRTKRRWVLSTIELVEEDNGPFPKEATKLFNDKEIDYTLKYFISGQGVSEPPTGVFSIDESTGVVFVHKPIDREKNPTFHIEFDVVDRLTNKIVDKTLAFDVAVKDINDNPPVFERPIINVDVKETAKEGDLPIRLSATDADDETTENSKFTMKIIGQDPATPKFDIRLVENSNLGQMTFKGCFDYDKIKKYKVLVEAKDQGSPPLSSTATVFINILDGNNHAPVFTSKQYKTEVMEMAINQEILRLKVEDKDLPNTPASQAVFSILEGNEDGHYKIETDPKTNEGVLTVVKGKDYERTTVKNLQIEVKNVEPLFVCPSGGPQGMKDAPPPQTASIAVSVIDVNDPPEFKKKINVVYQTEESDPGKVLFTPEVTDAEGDQIRYELAQDPEHWIKIDPKTGALTSVQKMDRESPYVNNSIYTILIHAIDNGKPPATGTGTVYVHLADINDNSPQLLDKSVVMCGNKNSTVEIKAHDKDAHPYGGPFSFSLRGEDPELKNRWKLKPETGESSTLHSLKNLAYGNYTVPLTIQDQQGKGVAHDLTVVMCNCGESTMCGHRAASSSMLGPGGILALVAGLLLLLLFLLVGLFCKCKEDRTEPIDLQDEGCQTLIRYNQEGGGSGYKAQPTLPKTPNNSFTFTDYGNNPSAAGVKVPMGPAPPFNQGNGTWRSQGMGMGSMRRDIYSQGSFYDTQRSRTMWSRSGTTRLSKQQSLASERNISDHLNRRLNEVDEQHLDVPEYKVYEYAYEGKGSACESLDQLSISNYGDNLDFLQSLGPKFNTLGGICHTAMTHKVVNVPM